MISREICQKLSSLVNFVKNVVLAQCSQKNRKFDEKLEKSRKNRKSQKIAEIYANNPPPEKHASVNSHKKENAKVTFAFVRQRSKTAAIPTETSHPKSDFQTVNCETYNDNAGKITRSINMA